MRIAVYFTIGILFCTCVMPLCAQTTRQAAPITVNGVPVSSQTMSNKSSTGTNVTVDSQASEEKSVWRKMGNGIVTGAKYTWKGIKVAGIYTWKGITKGAYYFKEGCVSVAEKTGLKTRQDELDAHQRIVEEANKTLIESRTRREVRSQSLEY